MLCFSQMSLEEKVGQMLMVSFLGETANAEAKTLIQEIGVGGMIYYNWANQLHSPSQIQLLSESLQSLAKIPLLIATDQEGGKVARLKDGFTLSPGNQAIGQSGDLKFAESIAYQMGKEMKSVGVNMNLAPVVDINTNPDNPVIGSRSFGNTPELVAAFGKATLDGYHQAGVITTLKHFPGHGDVILDSHTDLPIVDKSLEDLKNEELLPFSDLAHETDAIMTAHILIPAIDEQNCATISPLVINYLREEIGFKGVIVTDSLVMEGVLKQSGTVEEAAIRAIHAGCDLLILGGRLLNNEKQTKKELSPNDIKRIHHSIVAAVKNGTIQEERINQAVSKIFQIKNAYLPGQFFMHNNRLL